MNLLTPFDLRLCKHRYRIQVQSDLHFPAIDHGFKGSAWHGRIANGVQRHRALSLLYAQHMNGQVAPWWLEAPEDPSDGPDGPFHRRVYAAGQSFELAWYTAGVAQEVWASQGTRLSTFMHDVLERAGALDPAHNWPDPAQRQQRLCGTFSVQSLGAQHYPLKALQTPNAAGAGSPNPSRQRLNLRLVSMLRLDDGQSLRLAQQALARGETLVPKLGSLLASALHRFETLRLCEHPAWKDWLAQTLQQTQEAESQGLLHPCAPSQVWPWDATRWSAHAQRADPLGGLLGHLSYEGPTPLMGHIYPLLALAQWTRIGRKTALGAGQIEVLYPA